jgi:parallel beta-helix repeat protein
VPQDYPTIQSAINNASQGDTILVANGIYNEQLLINKTIMLLGAGADTTILNGAWTQTAAQITAPNVTIKGFTIQGFKTGIIINQTQNIHIQENKITQTLTKGAMYIINSQNITIANNTLTNNYCAGVSMFKTNQTLFLQNTVFRNGGVGVYFENCTDFVAKDNYIESNEGDAIACAYGYNLLITGNTFAFNGYRGIWATNSNGTAYHNNFIQNFENARAIKSSFTWDNGYPSGGNYWSNYTGIDENNDGISDVPLVINENNVDHFPLMKPYIAGDVNHDGIVNIKDATLVCFYWLQTVPPAPSNVDINDDGVININDASVICVNWQKTQPPTYTTL